ncbi:MAG: 16S rRNA (uracil(1498)-N(3))-methyltransferase [Pseudolabrys sp.]
MPHYDFRTPRLYVDAPLPGGGDVLFDRDQSNYLLNVLRLKGGDRVLLFNGRDGEWEASLASAAKRAAVAAVSTRARAQPPAPDLHFMFAPLKHVRLDYLVQKAVEMGVSLLQPVITRHTQVARVNLDRMRANVIEAAQQCGVLAIPHVAEPMPFSRIAENPDRLLIFCDEDADVTDPVAALSGVRNGLAQPLAVLIGPEGGFAEEERLALGQMKKVVRIALGPRILRADTAAVAALTLAQSVLGDWRGSGLSGRAAAR